MDALGHFGPDAWKVDQIPAENWAALLAVVDISVKASADPNAAVEVDDLVGYKRRHGCIAKRSFVAMNSGWEAMRDGGNDVYRGGVGFLDLNSPGFEIQAAIWLAEQRDVVCIGVDTLASTPATQLTSQFTSGSCRLTAMR